MWHTRISADPAVMMGKPCIKGTRITVELILRKLGAGRSFADLLDVYPQLVEDDRRDTSGIPDTEVLKVAEAEGRILITEDQDFGELVLRQRLGVRGIVLLE